MGVSLYNIYRSSGEEGLPSRMSPEQTVGQGTFLKGALLLLRCIDMLERNSDLESLRVTGNIPYNSDW